MENDTLETDVTTAADILLSLSVFAKLFGTDYFWMIGKRVIVKVPSKGDFNTVLSVAKKTVYKPIYNHREWSMNDLKNERTKWIQDC